MNFDSKKAVNILMGLVVVAGLILGYFFLFGGEDEIAPSSIAPGEDFNDPGLITGAQLNTTYVTFLINEISNIKLDRRNLESEAFKALDDFTIPIVPEPIGVDIPFGRL